MLQIEYQVIAYATQQANGLWIFERKDTHSWLGEAEHFRKIGRLDDANEAYVISGRLQALDNNE